MDPLEKIKELEALLKTLNKDNVKLKSDYEKAVSEKEDIETKLDTEKSKVSEIKTRADETKKHLSEITEAFGIEKGKSTKEAIESILEQKTSFEDLKKSSEEIQKYKILAPSLDKMIDEKKESFTKLYDKYKDNANAMKFVDYDPKEDADNLIKINTAFESLSSVDEMLGGKSSYRDNFSSNNSDKNKGKTDNGPNTDAPTGISESRFAGIK